jgi:hypothetical protein
MRASLFGLLGLTSVLVPWHATFDAFVILGDRRRHRREPLSRTHSV